VELLDKKFACVGYNDPYIPEAKMWDGRILKTLDLTKELFAVLDCVIIATDHSAYDYESIVKQSKLVFDCRGATVGIKADNIVRLGE
jgi:UDP-N-acetyl-D-glucosamine dehydrogenase